MCVLHVPIWPPYAALACSWWGGRWSPEWSPPILDARNPRVTSGNTGRPLRAQQVHGPGKRGQSCGQTKLRANFAALKHPPLPGQSVVQHGVSGWSQTWYPRCAQLDRSGEPVHSINAFVFQELPMHYSHMRSTVGSSCIRSLKGFEDLEDLVQVPVADGTFSRVSLDSVMSSVKSTVLNLPILLPQLVLTSWMSCTTWATCMGCRSCLMPLLEWTHHQHSKGTKTLARQHWN